ncbi:MAG: hypothetical protein M5U01_39450 [Ardenticatenaceae bacterium]|nr:hypothetical protein [Ardenticatenaceae bacterium]
MTLWFLLGILLVVLVGGLVVWWWQRSFQPLRPPEETRNLGYGRARWEREIALWEGTLRRLQTQAIRYTEVPPHLAREIERAEARLTRAREALGSDDHISPPES